MLDAIGDRRPSSFPDESATMLRTHPNLHVPCV